MATVLEAVGIQRPQRWDVPFGPDMTRSDVERLLLLPPFNRIDPTQFPPSGKLTDILQFDSRMRRFKDGDIIVRQGDYGNSAFYIMSGGVRVVLESGASKLPAAVLGRQETRKRSLWRALTQLWANPKLPEVRHIKAYRRDARLGQRAGEHDEVRIFLQDVPGVIKNYKTARIGEGEFFGEIAALGRTPRTATVFSDGPSELLEIRWQGLRDIRRRAPEIKQHIDDLYRKNSLRAELRSSKLFQHLSEDELKVVAEQTSFETYGDFDWHTSYKKLAEMDAATRLQKEPVIAEEGNYPNGLVLIRSGFARLSEKFNHGHRTVYYLGKGQAFGFQEIVHNWKEKEQAPLFRTLRAVGYVDILVVPTAVMEQLVLPTLPKRHLPAPITATRIDGGLPEKRDGVDVPQDMLEFLAERRFINGTATMMINLDRCVRCDDCVRACAATHGNNPRFIRHGYVHGSTMVANACMHCTDPVCLIGCPTGAIHRDAEHGQVVINDATCIGCATCANSCPYNNIRMVEIRDGDGVIVLDQTTNAPILKATKCDLCYEQLTSPSCERACPHDALKRIDMKQLRRGLGAWLDR